jgi:membrane-associated protein
VDDVTGTLLALAESPWLYVALFARVVGDAFLVILPSETVVVGLGALAAATGHPWVLLLIPVAAAGALLGDSLLFLIGRRIGIDRWAWQRRGRVASALSRARATVLLRPAVLIFTARYIPYARIAVNLSAGAAGLPVGRFLPLAAAAGTAWAIYNVTIGALFGRALPDSPLLAISISVAVAIVLGISIDLVVQRVAVRRTPRDPHPPAPDEQAV